jgi:hypothetical protein
MSFRRNVCRQIDAAPPRHACHRGQFPFAFPNRVKGPVLRMTNSAPSDRREPV